VTIVTYVIAIGGFSPIVVGSFDAFMLLVNLDVGIGEMLTRFLIPVLLGNIFGGTALFAYAQVMKRYSEASGRALHIGDDAGGGSGRIGRLHDRASDDEVIGACCDRLRRRARALVVVKRRAR
jgi:hypothetical protein